MTAAVAPTHEPEDTRESAETLLRGMDALMRRFASLGPVPLDVLDRYERLRAAAHAANLLRLDDYTRQQLMEPQHD